MSEVSRVSKVTLSVQNSTVAMKTPTAGRYRSARAAKKVRQPDAPRSNTIGPFAVGIGEGVRWGVKARQGPTVNVNTGTLSCQEASVFKPVDDEAGMPF